MQNVHIEPVVFYQWTAKAIIMLSAIRSRRNTKQLEREHGLLEQVRDNLTLAMSDCREQNPPIKIPQSYFHHIYNKLCQHPYAKLPQSCNSTHDLFFRVGISSFLCRLSQSTDEELQFLASHDNLDDFVLHLFSIMSSHYFSVEFTSVRFLIRSSQWLFYTLAEFANEELEEPEKSSVYRFLCYLAECWPIYEKNCTLSRHLFLLGDFSLISYIKFMCGVFNFANYDAFILEVENLLPENVPLAAVSDIQVSKHRAINERAGLKVEDFPNKFAYDAYVERECFYTENVTSRVFDNYPDLGGLFGEEHLSDKDKDKGILALIQKSNVYGLRPDESMIYFYRLIRFCFEYCRNEGGDFGANVLWSIIRSFVNVWRIHPGTCCCVVLDILRNFVEEDNLKFSQMRDIFHLTFGFVRDCDYSVWTISDSQQFSELLCYYHRKALHQLVETLGSCLRSSEESRHILDIMNDYIFCNPLFHVNQEDVNNDYKNFFLNLRGKYSEFFAKLLSQEMTGELETDLVGLRVVGMQLQATYETLKSNYKTKIFNQLAVADVFAQVTLSLYFEKLPTIMDNYVSVPFSEISETTIDRINSLYKQSRDIVSSMNSSSLDYPQLYRCYSVGFVYRNLTIIMEKAIRSVVPVILQESFLPQQARFCSESSKTILDPLQQSFDFLQKIDWPNDEDVYKFYVHIGKLIENLVHRYVNCLKILYFAKADDHVYNPLKNQHYEGIPVEKLREKASSLHKHFEKPSSFEVYEESLTLINTVRLVKDWIVVLNQRLDHKIIEEKPLSYKHVDSLRGKLVISVIMAHIMVPKNAPFEFYFLLQDNGSKSSLRTRPIREKILPTWKETYELEISGRKSYKLILFQKNYETGLESIYGYANVDIDPENFKKDHEKEVWLDLNIGGKVLITIQLLIIRESPNYYCSSMIDFLKVSEETMLNAMTTGLVSYIRSFMGRSGLFKFVRYLNDEGEPEEPSPEETTDLKATVEREQQSLLAEMDEIFYWIYVNMLPQPLFRLLSRLWYNILETIRDILIPPASNTSLQRIPLNRKELKVVYSWLNLFYEFFQNFRDIVPFDFLNTEDYKSVKSLKEYYFLKDQHMEDDDM
ncbi:C2 domain-containing protein Git1 [Schizosaccharomyces cryophilus OY26]|uniref:C2 domain-containing protein Git1 n=1 Tax=Schizosaccharomyces cryophilus (strain OY26 / ATCC MYA-4695 / CBS 11777 / NBRC 106824 / NRRL Y48691) TaxID=653667 RepID=S9W6Y1_SCHCR|nr:C2 domain-containing protein Git1 [Schizosaccharomyces cryophilus OY26]EPY53640.1 C2 domain-containing protein Git1 [Schizosaccharomyces cryophilus OY26]